MSRRRLRAYCSHSKRVKGFSEIEYVMRLCSPPWLLIILLIIHEVADPHTMSNMSFRADANPFQKCSNAERKLERGASIHGSSSMNTTLRSSFDLDTRAANRSNASNQFSGSGALGIPCERRDDWKFCNCALVFLFERPE